MFPQYSEDLTREFGKDNSKQKTIEDLKSHLIGSYEHAIASGLTPCVALAAILEWVAGESGRIHPD
jgi:hypothetical protein